VQLEQANKQIQKITAKNDAQKKQIQELVAEVDALKRQAQMQN